MVRVYIALGSNLGARARNVRRGIQLLAEKGFRVLSESPIYETRPVAMPGARRFLNMVAAAETELPARRCLQRLKEIECAVGRPARHPPGRPRSLDLDLLFYGREVIRQPGLRIPHPRMLTRAFVLAPLADIAPRLVHPEARHQIRTLLGQVERKGVWRWNGH